MSGRPKTVIVPDETRHAQRRAADPARSVWVSANAGSGKTWVLSERVIRLLLAGADPSRILCLTYTRAAAAQMSKRVFERLGEWTRLTDADLDAAIEQMEGHPPSPELRARARRLFARALETPGGLAIRTIHAFCESLLHRFPLEANVPGHFELMDERAAAALTLEARNAMLARIGDAEGDRAAFATVLSVGNEEGLRRLIDEIVSKRTGLTRLLRALGPTENIRSAYLAAFGLPEDADPAAIAAGAWPLKALPVDLLRRMHDHAAGNSGCSKAYDLSHGLLAVGAIDAPGRLEALRGLFLQSDGKPRKITAVATKVMAEQFPDLADRLDLAQAQVTEALGRVAILRQVEQSLAALAVADRLISGYEALKRRRGLLDFDDVIERTANLLMRDGRGWVQYKLDQGIDHILVDEAQDTAPRQWEVIEALAGEFFAGEGARRGPRTLFAVGDEKQSIYSFQGADPAGFAAAGARTHAIAGAAFERVGLTLSFRSTEAILSAVETVFAIEDHRRGLDFTGEGFPVHQSNRLGQPGWVELWPMERATDQPEPEDWTEPVDIETAPEIVTANRIAGVIAEWLKSGETLEATGQPLRAGDIIVLVRKRDRFVHALSRALKNAGVPVAGADRLRLTDHIAVKDLVALGRFVLQPADDLSLAALLKSPLFGWDDDDLFAVAHDRGAATLFEALRRHASGSGRYSGVVEQLLGWRSRADRMPVFEFYAHVLAADGGRASLIARLGPESADMLDEFLNLALDHERTGMPGLESFIAALSGDSPEIKREMDAFRDEVRIMTVHASKGLEAPVVFLVDPGSAASHASFAPVLVDTGVPLEGTGQPPLNAVLWACGKDAKNPVMDAVNAARKLRDEAEYRRLLYVAMTRAADRLIVAGYATKRGGGAGVWHSMVTSALGPRCVDVDYPGFGARRFAVGVTQARPRDEAASGGIVADEPMPGALLRPLPPEPTQPRPLSPSGVSLVIDPSGATTPGVLTESPLLGSGRAAAGPSLLRGSAVHRLLQVLPDIPVADREARARAWLLAQTPGWSAGEIDAIWRSVSSVLDDTAFADLFAPGSRAEVPLMGAVMVGGRQRSVSGVIDRIAVTDGRVLVADYKTNRIVPGDITGAPPAYVAQLALYRALLVPLYPDRTIEAALVFTEAPALLAVPAPMLDAAFSQIAAP